MTWQWWVLLAAAWLGIVGMWLGWRALRRERREVEILQQIVHSMKTGDHAAAARLLRDHPEIAAGIRKEPNTP